MATASRTSCERARALLSRQLDAGLSELERHAVGAHLERCAACRSFAAHVEWFTDELRRAPLVPLPSPVAVTAPRRRLTSRAVANVASAAALLAVTVGGVSIGFDARENGVSQALAASSQQDTPFGDAVLREFRRDALRTGELQILPSVATPRPVKPALPATDA